MYKLTRWIVSPHDDSENQPIPGWEREFETREAAWDWAEWNIPYESNVTYEIQGPSGRLCTRKLWSWE